MDHQSNAYRQVWQRSIDDPEGFWADAAEAISWDRRWDRVLDDSDAPSYRWFSGARLNTCYNALDRHVAGGRGDDELERDEAAQALLDESIRLLHRVVVAQVGQQR